MTSLPSPHMLPRIFRRIFTIGVSVAMMLPALTGAQNPLGTADEIDLGTHGSGSNFRETIITVLRTVLTYVTLVAVIAIIVAGLYLILGFGEDSSKEKAKKIIMYTIVGLLLIMLANAIVGFVFGIF